MHLVIDCEDSEQMIKNFSSLFFVNCQEVYDGITKIIVFPLKFVQMASQQPPLDSKRSIMDSQQPPEASKPLNIQF